jgi:precorrin-8X/cobalt-precorrin-8 methylmutase
MWPEGSVVLAEVYPSLWSVAPAANEPKDAAQVRTVARYFAERDRAGELGVLFAGDPELTREQRACVVTEEAWTLGVTRRAQRSLTHPRNPRVEPGEGGEGRGRYTYLRDPAEIARRSHELIRNEADLGRFPRVLQPLALRLAHAAGDTAILGDLAWSRGAVGAGRRALAAGAPILVDSRMVAAGIGRNRLPAGNSVICTLRDAVEPKCGTRSAAAVEFWREHLADTVVAIGSAPTALFRLLEIIAEGAEKPALVLGFPVGFVGAAEAKAALAAFGRGIAYITLHGRRGGSALAAAAVNALASIE